ncbi:MAG: hypothetical protein ACFCUQ_05240 [Kiloniellales bacterium]
MKRRSSVIPPWRSPPGPALAILLVAALVLVVYLHPWKLTHELPACDAQHVQQEVGSKILVMAPKSDVFSNGTAIEFNSFREIDAMQVKGVIYERTCRVSLRLDHDRPELRFQIQKSASAAGYRLSLPDA